MRIVTLLLMGVLLTGGQSVSGDNGEPKRVEHRFEYALDGVTIYSTDKVPKIARSEDVPRLASTISSSEALRRADAFLEEVFGSAFKPKIAGVALLRLYSIRDKDYKWEWHVSYYDPNTPRDLRAAVLIRIVLSPCGEVLMGKRYAGASKQSD